MFSIPTHHRFIRWRNLVLATFYLVSLAACTNYKPETLNSPTQTARAERVVALATQMGGRAAATAQALQAYLQKKDEWPVILFDSFDESSADWPLGPDTGDLVDISLEISSGDYIWQATSKDSFVYWAHPTIDNVTDFYLSVEVTPTSGPTDGAYGVVFREQVDSFYIFLIDNEQDYSLMLRSPGGWVTLIDWRHSSIIKPFEANRITVVAVGPRMVFFINDEYVASIVNDTIPLGNVALAINLHNPGEEAVFRFSDFELRGLVSEE